MGNVIVFIIVVIIIYNIFKSKKSDTNPPPEEKRYSNKTQNNRISVSYGNTSGGNKEKPDSYESNNSSYTGDSNNAIFTVSFGNSHGWNENKADDFKWIPPGESIQVAGYTIRDGMVYIGKHLKSISYYNNSEPGFIKVDLKVDSHSPDREGKNMDYWPSYSNIPPSSRAAYLEWLAGGKVNPEINIGYVFLFFYGIERRLLYDTKIHQISKMEISRLLDEINILLNIYGPKSGSFKHYASSLLEYVNLDLVKSNFYELDPPPIKYTYEISPIIKLALGQLAKEGKPIPSKWMYEYVMHHPEIYLRTPAKRCVEEFHKLFDIRYKEKFGAGIIIKPNKTKIKIVYTCASSGLRELDLKKEFDVPDVSILKSLLNKINPLINECQDELDKYSRWLGQKGNQKDSFIAYSLLPEDLVHHIDNSRINEFNNWMNNQFNEDENATISNSELLKWWPVKTPGKITKKELMTFISFLQKLGFGIEPDVRFDGVSIKEPENSILFKLDENEDILDSPSNNYSGKLALLHFAVAVAKADNIIAEGERILLIDSIENSSQLIPAEKRRMRSALTWLLQSDSVTKGLEKKIETFDQSRKDQLADYMIAIAGADGYISPEEVKMLTKLFKLLGFDEKQVYSSIHRYQTEVKNTTEELISVRPADSTETGFKIPIPSTLSEEKGFALDMGKIANKMKDSERVSALLEGVFEEEFPQESIEEDIVEENDHSIHGLDEGHTAILHAFQKQSLWPKSEFEKLTARFELLPDGALEILNEKAYELFDDALCGTEDDLIEINQEILEEFFK